VPGFVDWWSGREKDDNRGSAQSAKKNVAWTEGWSTESMSRPKTDTWKMMFQIYTFDKNVAKSIADEIDKVCAAQSKDEVIEGPEWSDVITKLTRSQVSDLC
jgi:hypothetical protein